MFFGPPRFKTSVLSYMLIHRTQSSTMEIGSILPHNGTEMDATPVLTQSSKEKITELSVNSTELHPSTV